MCKSQALPLTSLPSDAGNGFVSLVLMAAEQLMEVWVPNQPTASFRTLIVFCAFLGRAGKESICSAKTRRRRGPPAALSVSTSPCIISSPRRVFEKGQVSRRRKTERPGFVEASRLLGSESSKLWQTDRSADVLTE